MEEHSKEWWEKQAAQYRAELDQLNPRLNAAAAEIVSLKDNLAGTSAALKEALESAEKCRAESTATANAKVSEVTKQANSTITALKTALAQKNAALAPCIENVARQLAALQSAVSAGAAE